MKIKALIVAVVAGLIILINACEDKLGTLPVPVALTSCDTLNLTYSSGPNKMKPIIDAQCGTNQTACHGHGASNGFDYTTYAGIYTNISPRDYVYTCLFNGSPYSMPQTPQPGWSDSSACMLAKFKAWLNIGAPQ